MASEAQQLRGTNGRSDAGDDGPLAGYSSEPIPLRSYGVLLGTFAASLLAFIVGLRRSGRELPARIDMADIALLGAATHKATRIAAKDVVAAPLRAPFTRLEGAPRRTELEESPRGSGTRRAIGELITCPYCLGAWIGAAFVAAHTLAPRPTRLVATILTVHAISDQLHRRS